VLLGENLGAAGVGESNLTGWRMISPINVTTEWLSQASMELVAGTLVPI